MKKCLAVLTAVLLLVLVPLGSMAENYSYSICPEKSGSIRITHFTAGSSTTYLNKYTMTCSDSSVVTATLQKATLSASYVYSSGLLVGVNNYLVMSITALHEGTATIDLAYNGSAVGSYTFNVHHTWSEWETVTEATSTSAGLKKRTCSVCSKEEEKVSPRLAATITYKLNGGKNNPDNPATFTSGQTVTLKDPTRTGYDFKGWYKDEALTKPITQVKGTSNVTVYAKWSAHTYAVRFMGNNSTSGSMSSLSVKYGKTVELPANTFKRTGYKFNGWNTRADGSGTTYANRASVKNLTSKADGTVRLYARWKRNNYTVKFDGNGATSGKMSGLSMKYGSSAELPANAFKRTGYKFAGWNTKADGTGKTYANKASVKNLTAKADGVVRLYAQWKPAGK